MLDVTSVPPEPGPGLAQTGHREPQQDCPGASFSTMFKAIPHRFQETPGC